MRARALLARLGGRIPAASAPSFAGPASRSLQGEVPRELLWTDQPLEAQTEAWPLPASPGKEGSQSGVSGQGCCCCPSLPLQFSPCCHFSLFLGGAPLSLGTVCQAWEWRQPGFPQFQEAHGGRGASLPERIAHYLWGQEALTGRGLSSACQMPLSVGAEGAEALRLYSRWQKRGISAPTDKLRAFVSES